MRSCFYPVFGFVATPVVGLLSLRFVSVDQHAAGDFTAIQSYFKCHCYSFNPNYINF